MTTAATASASVIGSGLGSLLTARSVLDHSLSVAFKAYVSTGYDNLQHLFCCLLANLFLLVGGNLFIRSITIWLARDVSELLLSLSLGVPLCLYESCLYLFFRFLETRDRDSLDFCLLCLVPMITKLLQSFDFLLGISIVSLTTSSMFIFMSLRMPKRITVGVVSTIVSAFSMLLEGVARDTFLAVVLPTLWFTYKRMGGTQSEDTDRCIATLKYSNDAHRHLIGALKRKIEEETGERVSESDGTLTIFSKHQSVLEKKKLHDKISSIVVREIGVGGIYSAIVTSTDGDQQDVSDHSLSVASKGYVPPGNGYDNIPSPACCLLALLFLLVGVNLFMPTSIAIWLARNVSGLLFLLSFGVSLYLNESCIYLFFRFLETRDKEFLDFCLLCLVPMITKLLQSFDFFLCIHVASLWTSSMFMFMSLRMPERTTVGVVSAIVSAFSMLFEGVVRDTFLAVVLSLLWFNYKKMEGTQSEDTDRCRATLKYNNDAYRHWIGALKRKIEEETGERVCEGYRTITIADGHRSVLEIEKLMDKINSIFRREIEAGGIHKAIIISIKKYDGQQGVLQMSPEPNSSLCPKETEDVAIAGDESEHESKIPDTMPPPSLSSMNHYGRSHLHAS